MIHQDLFNVDLGEGSVDLVVTSPPYNLGKEYEVTEYGSFQDYLAFTKVWLLHIRPWLKKDARLCINIPIDVSYPTTTPFYAAFIKTALESGYHYKTTIIWNEGNISRRTAWGSWMSASSPNIICPVEVIVILYKDQWNKEHKGVTGITRDEFMEWTLGHWTFPGSKSKIHPATFPQELPRRCIQLFSYEEDVVLDPFAGIGTTLLVADELHRKGIGIEREKKYVEEYLRSKKKPDRCDPDLKKITRDTILWKKLFEEKVPIVVSFSGGKDSTAMCLWLLYESGISKEQLHFVYADTGWEHPGTYMTLLRMAERHPVRIIRSEKYHDLEGLMRKRGIPRQRARFCTQELKVIPMRNFVKKFDEAVEALGLRHEEGTHYNKRGEVPEFQLNTGTMMYTWYPVRHFTLLDVYDIHKKYDFPLNNVYSKGFERASCVPCIFSRKAELKLISEQFPERIDIIREIEDERDFPFISPKSKNKFHNRISQRTGKPYASIDSIIKWSHMSQKEVLSYDPEDEESPCVEGLCEL